MSCVIKDFCTGGMLIELVQDIERFRMNFGLGDELSIYVQVPTRSSFHNLQLKARIARATNSSLGVSFINPDQAALQALENYNRHVENSKTLKKPQGFNENTQRIHALCKRCAGDNITALMQSFFPQVDGSLMDGADAAKNNMVQGSFLAAARELKAKRREILTGFSKNVALRFDENLGSYEPDSSSNSHSVASGKLEIVGKEDFEGWLVSKIIIARANDKYSQQLLELKIRYSKLLRGDFDGQEIPVSPNVFCDAFSECFSNLSVETVTEKVIFNVFESAFINNLSVIYDEINSILINSGILPEIGVEEIRRYKAAEAKSSAPIRGEEPFQTGNPACELDVSELCSEAADGNDLAANSALLNASDAHSRVDQLDQSQVDPGLQPTSQKEEIISVGSSATNDEAFGSSFSEHLRSRNNIDREQFDRQQKIARDAYKTVQNLLEISEQQKNVSSMPKEEGPQEESASPINPEVLSQEEVLTVLDKAQKSIKMDGPPDKVVTTTQLFEENSNSKLCDADVTKFNNIDRLFEAMLAVLNNKEISSSLEKLKIPLSKLIFTDESFYENQIHPARLLINRVAELDEGGGVRNAKTFKEIDRVIASVVGDYGRDESVFDSALEEVNKLVEVKKRIYRKNINRVTESCNGQEKINSAKKNCLSMIDGFSTEGKILKIIPVLLEAGWKEVMMLSLLKPEGSGWDSCVQVLEKSIGFYLGNIQQGSEDFYKEVCDRIKAVKIDDSDSDSLFSKYKMFLGNHEKKLEYVAIENIVDLFTTEEERPRLQLDKINAEYIWKEYPDLRKSLVRAQNISIGDWVSYTNRNDKEESRRLRLAWMNDSYTSYVFVNQQGIKNLELSLIDLVRSFKDQTISIIRDNDVPLVERGLESMVQQAYSTLEHQTSHDQLTGLINRREFDRQVAEIVLEAKASKSEHVVCAINLDQFKVVNNTCGLDAGDQLLKDIAEILIQWMPQNGTVARLGNDEYGLIIRDADETGAYQVVDNQMHAVESFRFAWEDKTFSITASAGLFIVNEKADSAHDVIKSANEALISAKDAGRNRIQVFNETDDQLLERQDIMQWVTRLNQAMDEDKLHLRGQKISSVTDPSATSHYEVLLSVESETGEMLPPADFIQAAEKYNRMQAIDRWVIRNVFEWLDEHKAHLDEFSGLAINLSGHSMNDAEMLEYIFELFVKLKVPRNKVLFEVTETTAIANLDDAADFIREMRSIGCRFALDDFGVGLSSYGYLKHLPVDYVKIDGVFIKDIVNDKSDCAMVKSITEMVKFLGMKTVAEYVENDEILELLRDIGVDYAQGYGIEKPIPLDQVLDMGGEQRDIAALY